MTLLATMTGQPPPTLCSDLALSASRLCYLDANRNFTTMASRCHDPAHRRPLFLATLDLEWLTEQLHSVLNPEATTTVSSAPS